MVASCNADILEQFFLHIFPWCLVVCLFFFFSDSDLRKQGKCHQVASSSSAAGLKPLADKDRCHWSQQSN